MKIRDQEVKIIKEYKEFILVEFPAGFRECIDKFDLNKMKEEEQEEQNV